MNNANGLEGQEIIITEVENKFLQIMVSLSEKNNEENDGDKAIVKIKRGLQGIIGHFKEGEFVAAYAHKIFNRLRELGIVSVVEMPKGRSSEPYIYELNLIAMKNIKVVKRLKWGTSGSGKKNDKKGDKQTTEAKGYDSAACMLEWFKGELELRREKILALKEEAKTLECEYSRLESALNALEGVKDIFERKE